MHEFLSALTEDMNLLNLSMKWQPIPGLCPFYPQDCSSEWQVTHNETQMTAAVYLKQRYVPSALDYE